MEKLKEIIFNEYGLDLRLEPFGDNEARNNVFLGENLEKAFIIKVDDYNQLEQVKISIKIAANLLQSNLICSTRYLQTISGEFLTLAEGKIITVQYKENLRELLPIDNEDFIHIGEVIGEFHNLLYRMNLENLCESNFYKDFMNGDIPLAQTDERLKEIESFYNSYVPDYDLLTKGVVHNDLNTNNIFKIDKKYFLIDFEFIKKGPLISDLGVLVLEFWDFTKGTQDYLDKLKFIQEGYEKKIKLSEYDKKNIIIFSLRYLFSDENWYNYWSFNGNPSVAELIPEIREKQKLLLSII